MHNIQCIGMHVSPYVFFQDPNVVLSQYPEYNKWEKVVLSPGSEYISVAMAT